MLTPAAGIDLPMNTFVEFSIVLFLCAGIILLVLPVSWFPTFYDVRYMGYAALTYVVLVTFLPRLFRVSENESDVGRKKYAVDLFQFALAFTFISNAVGDLGLYQLYKIGFEFDKLLHFITPFLGVILISMFLNQWWEVMPKYSIVIALGFIIFCSVAWEIYEYLADVILKTHISGVYGLNISVDTKFDLFYDAFGAALGALSGFLFWGSFIRWTKKIV
jgi:hypothetical protein